MTERPRTMRGWRLLGLAAAAGVLAGLVAIYAGGGLPGNGEIAATADCAPAPYCAILPPAAMKQKSTCQAGHQRAGASASPAARRWGTALWSCIFRATNPSGVESSKF